MLCFDAVSKRVINIVLVASLILAGLSSNSNAATVGDRCMKVGRVVVSEGVTIRCTSNRRGATWTKVRSTVVPGLPRPTPSVGPSQESSINQKNPEVSVTPVVLSAPGVVHVTSNVVGTLYLVEESKLVSKESDFALLEPWWWMSARIERTGESTVRIDPMNLSNGIYRAFIVDEFGLMSRGADQTITISMTRFSSLGARSCSTQSAEDMCMLFDTSLDDLGSNLNRVSLPVGGDIDVMVDWGDGSPLQRFTSGVVDHTYASEGNYVVTIQGSASSFGSDDWVGVDLLTSVASFGNLHQTSLESAFSGAINLVNVPDTLPLTVVSTRSMFLGASAFNGDVSSWDVSSVTDMAYMFFGAEVFDQDLSLWDVSNVTNMALMFNGASLFNQDLELWDVSNVTDMSDMFVLSGLDGNEPSWY